MIKWINNKMPVNKELELSEYFNESVYQQVREFHESVPGYQATKLVSLNNLADRIGLNSIKVKDESGRYNLNAFKILGAGYAIGKYVKEHGNEDITFYSATDGNHGRAVAWYASKLSYKARIYMPKGSSKRRLQNILDTGAYGEITEYNYDDTVRLVNKLAKQNNGVVIQDTAWKGYETIPVWIMQGYSMIAMEAMEELDEMPTHIFLQAGVGSFASAIEGYFVEKYKEKAPKFVIFESDKADCYYKSAKAGDGKARFVSGDMDTIMAGLACGEPNTVSFEIVKNNTSVFASCDDETAALGMRIYGNPKGDDCRIISGESGAGTLGLLYDIMTNPEYGQLKKELLLGKDSRVLLISTEGNTDPDKYEEIVWKG